MDELELAAILCSMLLGGEPEAPQRYAIAEGRHHIRVDCETETHVIEIGLDDKRASFDSVHQALFAAQQTGKIPKVIIIDTNGVEESVEYQIKTVAQMANVEFETVSKNFLIRWQMTAPFRSIGIDKTLTD